MLEKMKEIIADQLGVSEDEVTLEASFKEDLDADSLDLFELVMALEEEYDVEIPSDDLAELNTVGDVINYLKTKVQKTKEIVRLAYNIPVISQFFEENILNIKLIIDYFIDQRGKDNG